MGIETLKKELIEYGKLCGEKNFTPGVSGNLSARYGDKILITSSGSANGYLCEDEFSLIDFDGRVVDGNPKASSEKMLHVAFYKMRKDINYIIHVHSPYLCTFASCGKALDEPLMAENIFYFGQIPLAEYGLPSSEDLVQKTARYFDKYDSVLMANHGFITGAATIKEAYLKLELAESYAQVVFNSKLLGGAVMLNQKQIEEIFTLKG
ncbi:TPA: class II aldolase/adducin family protein [Candidatus Scatousia excrementigallinarum]|uniref:Class II aldolase/adducin family protein n=1 Tax=Candidatus Scatousia excrementigallinarum TaxID=2840935 RepID=A0A9D1JPP8_9BACT|nr:class II aldolase/adducin family protein [Candidatus Scatousia excrementigallinarum]